MADQQRRASPSAKDMTSDLSKSVPFVQVYVKNLSKSTTEGKVRAMFESCGTVTNIRVVTNEKRTPVGVAFVTFAEPYMAAKACQALNGGLMPSGKKLYVSRAFTRQEMMEKGENNETLGVWKVGVENIPKRVSDVQLLSAMSRFGTVVAHAVVRTEKGWSLSYGFVAYLTREGSERAMDASISRRGITFGGTRLALSGKFTVHETTQPSKVHFGSTIHVTGVNEEKTMRKVFETFGAIRDIDAAAGFVYFKDEKSAQSAVRNKTLVRSMTASCWVKVSTCDAELYRKLKPSVVIDDKLIPVAVVECQVCLEMVHLEYRLSFGCGHQFCETCLTQHIEQGIYDLKIRITCPEKGCPREATQALVRMIASEKMYKKYQDVIKARKAIDYTRNHSLRDKLTDSLIDKVYKKCPICRIPIEKISGCPEMYCTFCDNEFWWGNAVDLTADARHPPGSPTSK